MTYAYVVSYFTHNEGHGIESIWSSQSRAKAEAERLTQEHERLYGPLTHSEYVVMCYDIAE